jgi:ketosteroid isomerase-like protein
MDRARAIACVDRLHAAQATFYAGGPGEALHDLLAEDVVWTVPGENAIAGVHTGRTAVMRYFARRRDLARATFRMHPGEVLVGDGAHVAVLTDGTAVLHGAQRRWSTIGLYRLAGELIAACWLLPLDPRSFDELWSDPAGTP